MKNKKINIDNNKNTTEELHKFRIPVSWQVAGTVVVEAKNINEAIEIAKDKEGKIPLPEGDYIEDSWQVDDLSPEEILDLYN